MPCPVTLCEYGNNKRIQKFNNGINGVEDRDEAGGWETGNLFKNIAINLLYICFWWESQS